MFKPGLEIWQVDAAVPHLSIAVTSAFAKGGP